jgi:hypothetical protein
LGKPSGDIGLNHYHGLPITPNDAARAAIEGGYAFVSHAYPDQFYIAAEWAKGFALDNGAFSAWTSGHPILDWEPYYRWVEELSCLPNFTFACIPDVIGGADEDNDALLAEWPWKERKAVIGVPIWHLHESLQRLERLVAEWPRIALGSSGDYAQVKSRRWEHRMKEAMRVLCDANGKPRGVKIHGLRMLDPDVFTRFPFEGADSTNIGQNIGIDSAWSGAYQPKSKAGRALVLRERIEHHRSPAIWKPEHRVMQQGLFSHLSSDAA